MPGQLRSPAAQPKSEMLAQDVLRLYRSLERLSVEIWIDGGWGVDALLGEQTRAHKDLDIVIQQKDVTKLRRWLVSRGYEDTKTDIARPHNFVLGDAKSHEIDVHVIVFDEEGNGIYGPVENGEMYPAASLTGTGTIDDCRVRCISPEWVVKFHHGYELKDKDLRDVAAICEKFGIVLPDEYTRIK